jgi:hypothetical protein
MTISKNHLQSICNYTEVSSIRNPQFSYIEMEEDDSDYKRRLQSLNRGLAIDALLDNKEEEYKKRDTYLEETFAGGRVHLPLNAIKTDLFGVYGVGFEFNNYGTKEPVRTNKKVGQFNIKTNELVTSWSSLIVAAKQLNMQFSTLSYNIRFGTVKNECIFRYIDN